MVYKRYIKGIYYQDPALRETLNSGMQSALDALRNGYPQGWTYQKLAEANKLSKNSIYQNCRALHKANIVKGKVERPQKYYFEDYNYINNKKERFRFPFAPGYVQYTEQFLDNYETLNKKLENEIYQIYSSLINILEHAVRNEKQTSSRHQCNFCGYDHEMRDFMRATLLHLIDELEANIEFIRFMQREGIINETAYERLVSEYNSHPADRATLKMNEQKETAQMELMKEQQSTHAMENKEQTARYTNPSKQHKTKRPPHTKEWKDRNSLLMRRHWASVTEDERQEFAKRVRKYDFDEHAFDKLSADAKYWIGYMMARVSIINRKSSPRNISFKFSIPKEDSNHLERFNKFIKSDRPVGFHKKKNVCELEFRSKRIIDELARYGIHNNMRYNEKVSKLEDDRDFWRGFIDGNASGKSGKFEISRYRSGYSRISLEIKKGPKLILQFKTFAENILGHSIGEAKPKVRNSSLTITDGNVVELYLKLLYDKNSVALDGNLKKIEQILSLPEYQTNTWVNLSLTFRKYFTHR